MNKQQGMTLLEMLVAVTISLLLMSGVLAIMSTTKKTSALQNELSRLQEDARFLMEDLSYNVRMAGYYGCSGVIQGQFTRPPSISVQNNQTVKDVDGKGISKSTPISDILTVSHFAVHGRLRLNYPNAEEVAQTSQYLGDLTESTPPDPPGCVSSVESPPIPLEAWCKGTATDINLCQQIVSEKNHINTQRCNKGEFSPKASHFVLHADSALPKAEDSIVVTDCGGADFYGVASSTEGSPPFITVTPNSTKCANRLCRNYSWPIEIFHIPKIDGKPTLEERLQVTYEVKAIDKNGDGKASDDVDGYALFRNDELFIEGVQALQIRYGIDTNTDGIVDQYVEADGTSIGSIIAVRVNILMRTANKRFDLTGATNREFTLDPNIEVFNPSADSHIEEEEGYRHRLLTMTIRVRNS